MRQDYVTAAGGEKRGADGGNVGEANGKQQHFGGVAAEPRDRRGDKSDDDERNAEIDKLSDDVLYADDNVENDSAERTRIGDVKRQPQNDADCQRADQFERQGVNEAFLLHFSCPPGI